MNVLDYLVINQSARLLFFNYRPLGYSNIIFYSPTEIKIAQKICCGHNSYNSYRNALTCTNFNFGCVFFTNK